MQFAGKSISEGVYAYNANVTLDNKRMLGV